MTTQNGNGNQVPVIGFEPCTACGLAAEGVIHGYLTKNGKRFPAAVVSTSSGNYLLGQLAEIDPDVFTPEVTERIKGEISAAGLTEEAFLDGKSIEDEARAGMDDFLSAIRDPLAGLMRMLQGSGIGIGEVRL